MNLFQSFRKFFLIFLLAAISICSTQANPLIITFKPQNNGVELSWTKVNAAGGYNLYRSDSRFGDYKLVSAAPVKKTVFTDNNGKFAYYKIAPVIAGKEKELSAPQSYEMELFGNNTYVFNPNDSKEVMKQFIDTLTTEMANGRISQFTGKRAAFLFKAGDYGWLQFENGFYMQVSGLGKLPTDTKIDKVYVTTDWLRNKNATCNFWRSIENLSLLNKDGKTLVYGISQAAPIRRMMINGNINLDMGGWASGGYLANSVVTGVAGSTTQQQFFIRNNETNFKGVNWNLVSLGNKGDIEMKANRVIIEATPVIYEKPFLFFENGDYFVFVPGRVEKAAGATWSNGKQENGKAIPLSDFYVARDDRDNAKTINGALAEGKNILFTPGIYKVDETLNVTKANTVILGLGMATIQPVNGNDGMHVADVEGVRIAGLIFDAGSGTNENTATKGSAILLQVGQKGSKENLSKNPVVLSDLFFRVGGADTQLPCKADVSLEINANSTIGDHFWIWRADHGKEVGWDLNKADYGLIVNGNDVTIYGLFVEHYQKYDTYWAGENGRMYFYQNEKAYDVPTQPDWTGPDGNHNGWAAYRVADNVKKHDAYGVGVYSVFNRTKGFVLLENAIVTPGRGDISVHYPFTVNLSTNGGIEHVINGLGGPHTTKDSNRGSLKTLPESFNKVWKAAPLFMLPPNAPQGEAKGIFPGRVAWVYAPNTANWDEKTGFWFDDQWNNQNNCDRMIRQSLFTLTGKDNGKEAWKTLFAFFNKNRGKKNLKYQSKEKIAIKINQNNTYSHENSEEINASPQLILSLLRSLVKEAGVPEKQITVFDASRYLTDYLYRKCASEFPHVNYVDNIGGDGRTKTTYVTGVIHYSADNGSLATGLATCLEEADYVINMAILKGHVGQGVTLCGKNWYGATDINADWHKNFHDNFNQDRQGKPKYITFVDFMGHKLTGEKTLIYFIDGLYGSQNVNGKPSGKWNLAPFNGNWPNSLFASQDPVAIDAVGLDFLSSEWPGMVDINYADAYLLEAAMANNPPSGTFYDPNKNGTRLKSLGVLEHWNNPTDKKYSRNLGKNEGIELVFKQIP